MIEVYLNYPILIEKTLTRGKKLKVGRIIGGAMAPLAPPLFTALGWFYHPQFRKDGCVLSRISIETGIV